MESGASLSESAQQSCEVTAKTLLLLPVWQHILFTPSGHLAKRTHACGLRSDFTSSASVQATCLGNSVLLHGQKDGREMLTPARDRGWQVAASTKQANLCTTQQRDRSSVFIETLSHLNFLDMMTAINCMSHGRLLAAEQ